jgi:hypothetical protein
MARTSLIVILTTSACLLAQSQPSGHKTNQSTNPAQSTQPNAQRLFTSEEKKQIISRLLESPRVAAMLRNQRYRVLSVALAPESKEDTVERRGQRIAALILFNYSSGKATRFLVDSSNGDVLAEEALHGRPQPSEEETQAAIKIVRQDPSLARLLSDKAVIDGGFAVDGPIGAKPHHRFIQFQILSADRLRLQRMVIVDLTDETIALSRANY